MSTQTADFSDIQFRNNTLRNLRGSGDLEPGMETSQEIETDEVVYTEFSSAEAYQAYAAEASKGWEDYLANLGEKEHVFEATGSLSFNRVEAVESVMSEAPVEKSTETATQIATEIPENNPLLSTDVNFFEEAGIKVDFKLLFNESKKGIFALFSNFKEAFSGIFDMVSGKVDKKAAHPSSGGKKQETDPEKAKKKAEEAKKNNIKKDFYAALRAQEGSVTSADAKRADEMQRENINLVAKIGQASYEGIKDRFGRLTAYAQSLFEKAQIDQEKQAVKQEKEMKIQSAGGAPDMGLDKVAEGGYLSSTGGQGAG